MPSSGKVAEAKNRPGAIIQETWALGIIVVRHSRISEGPLASAETDYFPLGPAAPRLCIAPPSEQCSVLFCFLSKVEGVSEGGSESCRWEAAWMRVLLAKRSGGVTLWMTERQSGAS